MTTVISFIGSIMDPIMGWIYRLCGSIGMTILLFTVLSKTVMLPLSVWVHMNGIKVIRMQPAINRIKIEHYGDKDAISDRQAKLYKKEKYSPIVSLIPLLFQILILMGVMAVIRNPSFRIHDMHFLGLDMSKTASANRGAYLLMPVLAGLSSLLLSMAQNRMNPLQSDDMLQGWCELNKNFITNNHTDNSVAIYGIENGAAFGHSIVFDAFFDTEEDRLLTMKATVKNTTDQPQRILFQMNGEAIDTIVIPATEEPVQITVQLPEENASRLTLKMDIPDAQKVDSVVGELGWTLYNSITIQDAGLFEG